MTQNGPYPGPPHPWSGAGSSDDYTEPADPWSGHAGPEPAPWGGHPTSTPPVVDSSAGYGAPTYDQAMPGWDQQPPPPSPPAPPRRRNAPVVALVAVLALLTCGGLGTTAWLLRERGTPVADAVASPATTPKTNETVDPEPRTSAEARFVVKGQCVHNEGTANTPDMRIVACASGTFEVLRRVDGRTTGEADAETKCARVPDYTKWFFYDSELDSLDFVLCLKER